MSGSVADRRPPPSAGTRRTTSRRVLVHVSTSYRSSASTQETDRARGQVRDTGLRPPLRSMPGMHAGSTCKEYVRDEFEGVVGREPPWRRHPSTGPTGGTSRFSGAWIRSVSSTRYEAERRTTATEEVPCGSPEEVRAASRRSGQRHLRQGVQVRGPACGDRRSAPAECDNNATIWNRDRTVVPNDFIVELSTRTSSGSAPTRGSSATSWPAWCATTPSSSATRSWDPSRSIWRRRTTSTPVCTGCAAVRSPPPRTSRARRPLLRAGRPPAATAIRRPPAPRASRRCRPRRRPVPGPLPPVRPAAGGRTHGGRAHPLLDRDQRRPPSDLTPDAGAGPQHRGRRADRRPGVSRRHCEIRTGTPSTIQDLGSTNGIVVDGQHTPALRSATARGSSWAAPPSFTGKPKGEAGAMSELTLTVMRLGFLAVLWLFVIVAVQVIRSDLFGTLSHSAARAGTAGGLSRPPVRRRPRRSASSRAAAASAVVPPRSWCVRGLPHGYDGRAAGPDHHARPCP